MPQSEGSSILAPVANGGGSDPAQQHENDKDDQDSTQQADAAVTKAVSIPSEATAEAAEEGNHQQND